MILTAIGKGGGAGALYPEFVGRRALLVGYGTGPAAYVSGAADPVTLNLPNYYIDAICGPAISVDGTYAVVARPSGTGARQTWSLYWYNFPAWTAASSGNLSGEQVQLAAFVGQF